MNLENFDSVTLSIGASVTAGLSEATDYEINRGYELTHFALKTLEDNNVNNTQFKVDFSNDQPWIKLINLAAFEISSNVELDMDKRMFKLKQPIPAQKLKFYLKHRTSTGAGESISVEFLFMLRKIGATD